MTLSDQLNSLPMYLICGAIILFVMLLSIFFLLRAWKAGIAIGMDRTKLRKTVISSCTFTLVPSISILVGVLTLSGALGVPLPWLRLSVIGALHYELSVADIAARAVGLTGLNASEMTPEAFTTIALVMSAGIIWGMVLSIFFNKRYTSRLQKPKATGNAKKSGKSLGDVAMTSMFIGLVAAYVGSYVGQFTSTGNLLPLIVLCSSAAAMAGFAYLIEKKKLDWLENFSIAGSMLIGMVVAVLVGGVL